MRDESGVVPVTFDRVMKVKRVWNLKQGNSVGKDHDFGHHCRHVTIQICGYIFIQPLLDFHYVEG